MQQGSNNVMGTSSAAPQESSDIETQSFESESSYDIVIEDTNDREFDRQTLDALGVVGRSEQEMNSADQHCDYDDDETYAKRVVDVVDLHSTSPKRVNLPEETSVLQPSTTQIGCWSNGMSHCNPVGGCGSYESEGEVTVSSHRHAGDSEFHSLTTEDAAEENTVIKNPEVDMFPAAAVDDVSDDINAGNDDDGDNERGPSSSVELRASGTIGLAESRHLGSVQDIEVPAQSIMEDSFSMSSLLINDLNWTDETVFTGELQSDSSSSVSPTSLSVQQESPVNIDASDDQSNDNSPGNSAPLDQRTTDYWSLLRSTVICTARIGMYIYCYSKV